MNKGELTFTEYVFMICYYVMFSKRELNQFLFGSMDTAGKQFLKSENIMCLFLVSMFILYSVIDALRKDEFEKFIVYLGEGSGRSLREWSNQVRDGAVVITIILIGLVIILLLLPYLFSSLTFKVRSVKFLYLAFLSLKY